MTAPRVRLPAMHRAAATALLAWRFVRALVVAGVQTAWLIVRAGPRGNAPATGFIRVPVAPMSPQGMAALACLVSLTPGTSVVDVDAGAHALVLHLLDERSAEAVVIGLRRDFEPALIAWFGTDAP